MVSNLYLYTNTPPHRYGTQAPKVAETVNRANGFNLKKKNKSLNIDGVEVERLQWEIEDGIFPYNPTHDNFDAFHTARMAEIYLQQNIGAIQAAAKETIQIAQSQNADILAKGRQTLASFTNQSVTASVAFQRMYDFFTTHWTK